MPAQLYSHTNSNSINNNNSERKPAGGGILRRNSSRLQADFEQRMKQRRVAVSFNSSGQSFSPKNSFLVKNGSEESGTAYVWQYLPITLVVRSANFVWKIVERASEWKLFEKSIQCLLEICEWQFCDNSCLWYYISSSSSICRFKVSKWKYIFLSIFTFRESTPKPKSIFCDFNFLSIVNLSRIRR